MRGNPRAVTVSPPRSQALNISHVMGSLNNHENFVDYLDNFTMMPVDRISDPKVRAPAAPGSPQQCCAWDGWLLPASWMSLLPALQSCHAAVEQQDACVRNCCACCVRAACVLCVLLLAAAACRCCGHLEMISLSTGH